MIVRINIGTKSPDMPQNNLSRKNSNTIIEPAALEAKFIINERQRLMRNDTNLIHFRRRIASIKIMKTVRIEAEMAVSVVKRLIKGLIASAWQTLGKMNRTDIFVNANKPKNCSVLF